MFGRAQGFALCGGAMRAARRSANGAHTYRLQIWGFGNQVGRKAQFQTWADQAFT
jgi:hypothetical protein